MPRQDNIDVRIVVNGEALHEYEPPSESLDTANGVTRYVEVAAVQQFSIRVTWAKGFKWHSASALSVLWTIDGLNTRCYALERGKFFEDKDQLSQDLVQSVEYLTVEDEATGEHKRANFTFGILDLTDQDLNSNVSQKDLSKLGCINVQFFRAHRGRMAIPEVGAYKIDKKLEHLSEKMMKGRDIQNSTKFEVGALLEKRERPFYYFDPIPGRYGCKYNFNFLYRSRGALQRLGCIPRTPSPLPDINAVLERTEVMLELAKDEARKANLRTQQLQERLDKIEAGQVNHNKGEASPTDAGRDIERKTPKLTTIKPENPSIFQEARGIKRQHEEENENDEELATTTPWPKKTCDVIDLTEEDD